MIRTDHMRSMWLRLCVCYVLIAAVGVHSVPTVHAAAVSDVSVGTEFACAVTAGNVYCWGKHSRGQLGTNQGPGTYAGAQRVVLSDGSPLTGVSQLASIADKTCALKSGQVWCWGGDINMDVARRYGTLPDGLFIGDAVALAIGGIQGANFYCVIRSTQNNSIWCWGANSQGQLGRNSTNATGSATAQKVLTFTPSTPAPTALTKAQSLSAGDGHICATVAMANPKLGNTVYCWGNNVSGQIGNGLSGAGQKATTATQLKTASGVAIDAVTSVSAGFNHSCVVLKNTRAMCWGYGNEYELGDGRRAISSRALFVKTDASTVLTGVTAVAAGDRFTCALKNTDIWCWGTNTYGQFGDDLVMPAQYAVRTVTTILDVVDIDTSRFNVCAVNGSSAAAHKVYCSGKNGSGQLGNRTWIDSRIHVAVKYQDSGATFP